MSPPRPPLQPWRVGVTRDEPASGPLSSALRGHGFVPVACPVLTAEPPADTTALTSAAGRLDAYDWVICASARAVNALAGARGGAWPHGVRTAAVGPATAEALRRVGAAPEPLTVSEGGAEPLWTALAFADRWPGRRVLVPTTPGGRRVLAQQLAAAGAVVEEVEAYRMVERSGAAIAEDWRTAAPDAVVVASARVAQALVGAVGAPALTALAAVIAIGATTAAALHEFGIARTVAGATTFTAAVEALAARRQAEVRA